MLIALLLLACAEDAATPADYAAAGPHTPAHTRFYLESGGRTLDVEVWYPAAAAGEGDAVPARFLEGDRRDAYEALLSAAPAGCPSETTPAGWEVAPAEGPWPLLVFSHCHECVRFSSFTVADHLASHGFVVAAPDHEGNTLFDYLGEDALELDTDTLALRLGDMQATLDTMLTDQGPSLLHGALDPTRVGVLGHSFGSVTAGLTIQEDGRPAAAMGLAAPMENPLLPGVEVAGITDPLMFLVAREDNSITELGNELIRDNYEAAGGPAWKAEVDDAGHWSFSDIVGLDEPFMPGCGEDTRGTDGTDFSYLTPSEGRADAGAVAAAFFSEVLLDDEGAVERLSLPGVEVEAR